MKLLARGTDKCASRWNACPSGGDARRIQILVQLVHLSEPTHSCGLTGRKKTMASSHDYRTLIGPAELAEIMDQAVIFDVRFSLADPQAGQQLYLAGHIPDARFLDLDRDLSGPVGQATGRHPLPKADLLAEKLAAAGVHRETQVVAYDDSSGAFAARLWWLLRWLGHERAAVLDGGYAGWQAADLPISTVLPEPRRGNFQAKIQNDLVVSSEALGKLLEQSDTALIDARGAKRFRGEEEPIDPVAGHIPGAVNLPFAANLDETGRFLSVPQLRQRHHHPQAVHMCGSGVTACHNILASCHAGNAMPRLYVGSWSEWITDASRPVAVGT